MKKSIIIAVACCFLASCAMHGGYVTNSAALGTNNFAYVKRSIEGTAKATYIFGCGGLSRQALVEEARQDLLKNFPIQDNQAFVNITVSFKMTYVLPIFMENKCTVSASVVQFNPIR